MKKILAHLTGIVFLITILVAGGCGDRNKQNDSTPEENVSEAEGTDPIQVAGDSTVTIFLKDTIMNGTMHLLMSDSRNPTCNVIDNLTTVVYPGNTVIFKKTQKSNVNKVIDICLVEEDVIFLSEEEIEDRGLYQLIISPEPPDDTIVVKYDIVFTVKKDLTEWVIDPYLKIPPP